MEICRKLIIFAIMFLVQVGTTTTTTQTYYMAEMCGESEGVIIIDAAATLELTHPGVSTKAMYCEVKVRSNHHELLFMVDALHIPHTAHCVSSRLDIYDGDTYSKKALTGPYGLCGYAPPLTVYTTESQEGLIRFRNLFQGSRQFSILITARVTGICCAGACGANFLCDNGYCIPDRLTCDGDNNCGDNSDEGAICDVAVGAIVGISLATLVTICVTVTVLGLICRKSSYYKQVVSVSQKPISLSRQNSEYRSNYGSTTSDRPVSPPSYQQSARV